MANLTEFLDTGWIDQDPMKGGTKLPVGLLTEMLGKTFGDRLKFNTLSLFPEFDGQEIGANKIENFYIDLDRIGWRIDKNREIDGLKYAASQNSYHPPTEYFLNLEKDNSVYPVDANRLASDFLDTNDPLYDVFLKTWGIGAVSRVLNPGVKFDYMLVLQGQQGIGKSTFFRALTPSEDWFCDTWTPNRQELLMQVNTHFIYEHAELEMLTGKRAVGEVRALITRQIDAFRPPYGRGLVKPPRPSVMCGTVNSQEFLEDKEGNRRFMVIHLPHTFRNPINFKKVAQERDSIWKALLIAWRNGEQNYLNNQDQDECNRRNALFETEPIFLEPLRQWTNNGFKQWFTLDEAVIESGIRTRETYKKADQKPAAEALRKLGYVKKDRRINGKHANWWHLPVDSVDSSDSSDTTP